MSVHVAMVTGQLARSGARIQIHDVMNCDLGKGSFEFECSPIRWVRTVGHGQHYDWKIQSIVPVLFLHHKAFPNPRTV